MINLGVWVQTEDMEAGSAAKRKLKAAGCNKMLKIKASAFDLAEVKQMLNPGDRLTIPTLSDLNIKVAELVKMLADLNESEIEFYCLDGLILPAGKAGEPIIQWLFAVIDFRSTVVSRAVKTGISRNPPRRKLKESDKKSFLADARNMSQVKLADQWKISIATARKYLAEWGE